MRRISVNIWCVEFGFEYSHCEFLLYKFNSRKVTTRKQGGGERGWDGEMNMLGVACFSFVFAI